MTINAVANTSAAFTLDASAENDGTIVYVGGAGIDTVTGTTGADTIGGGAGADVITGGNGSDTITGGAGADTFTYTAVAQSTGTARDSVTDFVSGTDKIAITLDQSASTAGVTIDATIQTAQAGTSAVQAAMSGSIGQTFYDTENSRVIVNANADNLVTTLDYQIDVNAAATTSTLAAGDVNYTITGGSGQIPLSQVVVPIPSRMEVVRIPLLRVLETMRLLSETMARMTSLSSVTLTDWTLLPISTSVRTL